MLSIEVTNELSEYLDGLSDPLEPADQPFCCIYGSSTYLQGRESSDIDLFFAVHDDQFEDVDLDLLVEKTEDLHTRLRRKIDNEVPYTTKLLYKFSDIENALTLRCFEGEDGELTVPQVVKSEEFLSSNSIKERLALNALTTPHLMLGNEGERRTKYERLAGIAMLLVGITLSGGRLDGPVNEEEVIRNLVVSPSGETGEMYLGYKIDRPQVIEYLRTVVSKSIEALNQYEVLASSGIEDGDPTHSFTSPSLVMKRLILEEA